MKKFKYTFVLTVIVCMAFLGCSDKTFKSNLPTSVNYNSSSSIAKTSGSGAWIFRFEGAAYVVFYDANSRLFLTLGINDITSFCSGNGGVDFSFAQVIAAPTSDPNIRRALEIVKNSNMSALVWKVDSPPAPDYDALCNFLSAETPFAAGTVNLIYTDNDFYTTTRDHNNSNAFGFTGNGTVQGEDGQIYTFTLIDRIVWDGTNTSSWNQTLRIQLMPVGK